MRQSIDDRRENGTYGKCSEGAEAKSHGSEQRYICAAKIPDPHRTGLRLFSFNLGGLLLVGNIGQFSVVQNCSRVSVV